MIVGNPIIMILKAILNWFRLRRNYIANAVDKIPPEIKDALVAWYSPVKQKLSNYDVIESYAEDFTASKWVTVQDRAVFTKTASKIHITESMSDGFNTTFIETRQSRYGNEMKINVSGIVAGGVTLKYRYGSYEEVVDITSQSQLNNPIQSNRQQLTEQKINLWDEIDKEVGSLNNDQQTILAKDEVYNKLSSELQILIQEELINSVKDKVANSSRGKELLEKQLNNIRTKKDSIIEEANKELELFKKFQIAAQANPKLTYVEFCKTINNE